MSFFMSMGIWLVLDIAMNPDAFSWGWWQLLIGSTLIGTTITALMRKRKP